MNVPVNKALYSRVKSEAKRKFKVYPSAYANAWLVREYKKRGGTYRVEKNVAKSSPNPRAKGGLTRWFKENWVDVKTGTPCGRSKGEKRGYPAGRPSKRISSKTPKPVGELTAAAKARFKREKTSSKKITYQHRRKKKKK